MTSRAYRSAVVGMMVWATLAPGLGAGVANAQDPDATLLASVGEFELGDGDAKVIVDRSVAEPYRICVREVALAVPLKVTADGANTIVGAGECDTFNAKHIRITPAGALKADTVLIGRYEHLKK